MIPKAKNTKNIADHRPTSLLPTIRKLLEQILPQRVYAWAENNNKINKEQSGLGKIGAQWTTCSNLCKIVRHQETKKKDACCFYRFRKSL